MRCRCGTLPSGFNKNLNSRVRDCPQLTIRVASIQIRGGGIRLKEVAGRYMSLDLSMGLAMGTSMDMTTQR